MGNPNVHSYDFFREQPNRTKTDSNADRWISIALGSSRSFFRVDALGIYREAVQQIS